MVLGALKAKHKGSQRKNHPKSHVPASWASLVGCEG